MQPAKGKEMIDLSKSDTEGKSFWVVGYICPGWQHPLLKTGAVFLSFFKRVKVFRHFNGLSCLILLSVLDVV